MPPTHLTPGDVKFLAAMSPGNAAARLEAIVELTADVAEAARAAGVEPDWSSLEAIDDAVDDPDRLDEIRAELRGQVGSIERANPTEPQENNVD